MNPTLEQIEKSGLSRRVFLRNLLLSAGSIPTAQFLTACGGGGGSPSAAGQPMFMPQPGTGGSDPTFRSQFATMGPLQAANADGIQLPAGFTSRVVAVVNEAPLGGDSTYLWHSDPDGGATFSTDDGGWIYVSNAEVRDATTGGVSRENQAVTGFRGGVGALRFNSSGDLIDAYSVQQNTTTNCSGGATPWGTWINGEEIQDGFMFECSPLRDGGDAVRLDRFGRKGHEMVTVDEAGKAIYHTEDAGGTDRFYRTVFTTAAWPDNGRPDMTQGKLQVLSVPDGIAAARQGPVPLVWLDAIDNGTRQPDVRLQESTLFEGNEGVWYVNGFIFFTTKGDDNIWAIDVENNTIESIYDPTDGPIGSPVDANEPPMSGVDNISMTLDGEMLVVEDGGDMRCMVLLPDRTTIPLLRLPGNANVTEVTGVAIGPTGDKVYVSGQRSLRDGVGAGPGTGGITYEITLPFTVRVDRPVAGMMPAAV